MTVRFNITIGILFILAGGLLGSDYIIKFVDDAHATYPSPNVIVSDSASSNPSSITQSTALPTHVGIPSADISVDVDAGYYDSTTSTWTLGNAKAYFATLSTPPNAVEGNTYIYGHNRDNIFLPLNKVTIGTESTVIASDGKTFTYRLSSIHDVLPTDSSWLIDYRGEPILTLQTCTGLWDQYRRLFVFDFVSES